MARIDILGRLDTDTSVLRARLASLARQQATGLKAELPGDLGAQLPRALSLRAEIARRDTYGTMIGQALSRTEATQQALGRLAEIAREFGDKVAVKLDPNSPDTLPLAASQARQALVEVGQLLNTQQGGEYLFGGSDFSNPPLPDPEGLPAGGMATQVAAAIATLGPGNAAAVSAATQAAALDDSAGTTPFSAFVTDPSRGGTEPRRSIVAADGMTTPVGLFANRNAAARSAGETTGSWARDLLRGLASIAALTPAQTNSPEDFRALADTIRGGLQSAANALADEQGALGQTEAQLANLQSRHAEMHDSLKAQLAGIEEVDMAEVLTRLQATKTALEASYNVIGTIGTLSLVSYLR
ncbi:flagellin N-terminal helical domain-containing protein [Belnapia rosea]|uniref:Flagellin n=1 Tax=Belnapia rosea TaxID=938405 RepID=A0A1G6P6C5_9PROT|nr:flagellin [Belnapia rosea]SDB53604.1 flagellin C-terminal helical region [Belnapia rosea]SDC75752.1 flagellin C-terminal helical region [Belnapia rosea]